MEDKVYKIYDVKDTGEVNVTEEVIAIIAGLAATETEGIHSMAGGITNELVAKLGRKNLSAGVDVVCDGKGVQVALSLVIECGYNIPEVTTRVQEKVVSAIENMTGLKVKTVNINVANVNISK